MRRMITNKQVVEVVNKAIDDGEIQAGGLTPEQEEKLDNSLQLPESAPAAQQLVGINTSNEQNNLGIGDGLEVANGNLLLSPEQKILVFNINSASSSSSNVDLTLDQETLISTYKPIIKVNFTDTSIIYVKKESTNIYYGFLPDGSTAHTAPTFLNSTGNKISVQDSYLYKGQIGTHSISFSRDVLYILKDKPSYLVPTSENGITNVNSGDTITNSAVKKLISYSGCFKINDRIAYPMYRDTGNKMSYYFNTISSSGNLVQTVYEINETTWVVTFVTKTIS